jgi:LAO/AO transport system kinase
VAAGEERALARAITRLESRREDAAALSAALHGRATGVPVLGVTGPPGVGKSTLVDALAARCVDRGERVAVLAVDPSSPYTGGAVLGDRVRMRDAADGAFVRSLSAPSGTALATVIGDAIVAADAAEMDRVIVETVGAGQSEVDIVRTADTVLVLVAPTGGDDVQALKAGVLEIGDVFVCNKADLDGADAAVADLEEMVAERSGGVGGVPGRPAAGTGGGDGRTEDEGWTPPVVRSTATTGAGVDDVLAAVDDHGAFLDRSGERAARRRERRLARLRRLADARLTAALDRAMEEADWTERLAEESPPALAAEIVRSAVADLDDT